MTQRKISKEEFEAKVKDITDAIHNSMKGMPEDLRHVLDIRAYPCDCGYEGCEGWQMMSKSQASILAQTDPEIKKYYDEYYPEG